MKREISDKNILDDVCKKFCDVLEKHCKYVVVAGFVSISSGRSRGTQDIDIIIEKMDRQKFSIIHAGVVAAGFEAMQSDTSDDIYDYLKDKLSVRYIYQGRALPEIELMFSKDILDDFQLKNRLKIPMTGLDVWFSDINTNIAFKELYLGSDKDMEDAKHLRIVFESIIDENKINRIKDMIRKYRMG